MTTTGTYNFGPATSDLVIHAFANIGIRAPQIGTQGMMDAAMAGNLLMVEWTNRQPNLWTSNSQTLSLVKGTATYTLPANMVAPLILYLNLPNGASGGTNDIVLTPLSTFDYGSIAGKSTQAQPTQYWFNRQTTPQITFYPTPDKSYTLTMQSVRQIQDVSVQNGATIDAPYRWLDAFTKGLSHRLSMIYANKDRPTLIQDTKAEYNEAWMLAANEDQEDSPVYITPMMGGYFR